MNVGLLCVKVGHFCVNMFAKEPYKRDNIAKETYDFKEPTNHSHPIIPAAG